MDKYLLLISLNFVMFVYSLPVENEIKLRTIIHGSTCNFPPMFLATDELYSSQFGACSAGQTKVVIIQMCSELEKESMCYLTEKSSSSQSPVLLPTTNITKGLYSGNDTQAYLTHLCQNLTKNFPWKLEECLTECSDTKAFFICDLYMVMDTVLRNFFEQEVEDYTHLDMFVHSGELTFLYPFPPVGSLHNRDLLGECASPSENQDVKQLCKVIAEVAVKFVKNRVKANFHEKLVTENVTSLWDPCPRMSSFADLSTSVEFSQLQQECSQICKEHMGICKMIYLGMEMYKRLAGPSGEHQTQTGTGNSVDSLAGNGKSEGLLTKTDNNGEPGPESVKNTEVQNAGASNTGGQTARTNNTEGQDPGKSNIGGQDTGASNTFNEEPNTAQGNPEELKTGKISTQGPQVVSENHNGQIIVASDSGAQITGKGIAVGQNSGASNPEGLNTGKSQQVGTNLNKGQNAGAIDTGAQGTETNNNIGTNAGIDGTEGQQTGPITGGKNAGTSAAEGLNTGTSNTGGQQPGFSNNVNQNTGEQHTGTDNTGGQQPGVNNNEDQNTGEQHTATDNTGGQQPGPNNIVDQNTGEQQNATDNTGEQQTGLYNNVNQNTGEQQTGTNDNGLAEQQSNGQSRQFVSKTTSAPPLTSTEESSKYDDYYEGYSTEDYVFKEPAPYANQLDNKIDETKKPEQAKNNMEVRRGPAADDDESSGGHFMAYFLVFIVLTIAGYIIFHNKQKIIALVIEGKSGKGGRRPNTKDYKQLKTDDVMPSLEKSAYSKDYVF